MHKLAIFMIGLLVILLPVGNSLNNQNANAITDYDNKVDKQSVSVSSLKCNNINVNVNGLELSLLPPFLGGGEVAATAAEDNSDANSFADNGGSNGGSQINGFRLICINNNNNTVSSAGNDTIPPTPPAPPTASLTVKKQVFGCATIPEPDSMDCGDLDNNSTDWLDCNNSSISGTIFCQSLPPSYFDIEVNSSNTQQIKEFEGSTEGTTIQNLDPGTYTVNEIIYPFPGIDRLSVNGGVAQDCMRLGFDNGGESFNSTSNTVYLICLQYEDQQGNDCSTITLTAAEARTCTVKNYIQVSNDFPPNSNS